MVESTPVDWPEFTNPSPWIIERTDELAVTFNDCFYRNMYKYKYIALLDLDEAIVPLGNLTSWSELIKIVETDSLKENVSMAAYNFQNINFVDEMTTNKLKYMNNSELEEIPQDLHILRNVYREHRYSSGEHYNSMINVYFLASLFKDQIVRGCTLKWKPTWMDFPPYFCVPLLYALCQ